MESLALRLGALAIYFEKTRFAPLHSFAAVVYLAYRVITNLGVLEISAAERIISLGVPPKSCGHCGLLAGKSIGKYSPVQ